MASKLSQLRQGKRAYTIVSLRDIKVAVVIVSADDIKNIEEEVERYSNNDGKGRVNDTVRNQYFDQLLCFYCMRDPEDLSTKFADSVKEVAEVMDLEDIGRITRAYGELMVNKAPKLEFLSEEEFESLKETLGATRLNDLNTVSLVHLTNFRQAMLSDQ